MNHILIITSNAYPNGFAVANRITTVAKGLAHNGFIPKVLIIRKTELENNILNETKGENSGIKFKYVFKNNIRNKNKYFNFISQYFGGLLAAFEIIKNKSNYKAVIIYDQSISKEFYLIAICKLLSIQIWKDESEFPEVYFWKTTLFQPVRKWIYFKLIYTFYSGIITITKNLDSYLRTNFNKNTCLVNMMVDFDRFHEISSSISKFNFPYVCYTGSINYKKDGIDTLVETFAEISLKYDNLKLVLIGSLVENFEKGLTLQSFKDKLEKLRITNKVVLLGNVKNELIPSYLKHAQILVLTRPKSIQAKNGFPTKLGEYLASSRPTICSSVGEIPNYLTNEFDSLLVEPGDKESIKNAFYKILDDEIFANKIAENGYNTAKKYFNYESNLNLFSERLNSGY